jgi:excisionase family DNA binding protein
MLLSVGQASRLLGVTPATVRRWTEIGLLSCERTAGGHRRVAREDVLELARAIGDSSHLAVRQAREKELETLVEASIAVTGQLERGALLAEIAKHVTRLCRCHTCVISSYAAEEERVEVLAEYDAGGRRTPVAGVFDLRRYPQTQRLLKEQRPMLVNADDRRADAAELALLERYGDKSVLLLPLVYQGRTIGLLEAIDRVRPRSYTRQELRLASALAGQAAVALRNAELYDAAATADTAMDELLRAMAGVAAGVAGVPADRRGGALMTAVAGVLCEHCDATSVVITRDGTVVGAAVAPSADGRATGDVPAKGQVRMKNLIRAKSSVPPPSDTGSDGRIVTGVAENDAGRFEITLATERPVPRGLARLLDVAAGFAALAVRGEA